MTLSCRALYYDVEPNRSRLWTTIQARFKQSWRLAIRIMNNRKPAIELHAFSAAVLVFGAEFTLDALMKTMELRMYVKNPTSFLQACWEGIANIQTSLPFISLAEDHPGLLQACVCHVQ